MNDKPNENPDTLPQPLYVTLILDESGSGHPTSAGLRRRNGPHRATLPDPVRAERTGDGVARAKDRTQPLDDPAGAS